MTEGVFIKRKSFSNILCLVCGLFLIGLFIFLRFVDSEANNSIFVGISFGLIITMASLFSLLLNFKAFLIIDGNHIKGKYHWFGKIDCDISEVDFAICRFQTIVIEMKNGKRHAVMGVANAGELCAAIRKELPFERISSRQNIAEQIKEHKKSRKNDIYTCVGMCAMMFLMIFVAVIFTDAKEHMSDFTSKDWVIFSITGSCFVLALIMAFVYAGRAGKALAPIQHLEYVLRRTVAETHPIQDTRYKSVYADFDYYTRVVVYEDPPKIVVQKFVPMDIFIPVHFYEGYEDEEELTFDAEQIPKGLIDITDTLYPAWFYR